MVDLVQLWKSPTAKLPEYLNWQYVFVQIEILPTREENIGKYAIPRCMFGWFGFLTEDNKFSINYLIDTTRLYKQKTSAATRPSQGFEIPVQAGFRSHQFWSPNYILVLTTRSALHWIDIRTELTPSSQ